MSVTKSAVYAKLAELNGKGVDTSKQIRKLAESDSIPISVIAFINKNTPLDGFNIYNKIYENRKRNPLYKTIVDESLPAEDKALALSSVITQTLIETKGLDNDSKKKVFEIMCIKQVLEALYQYVVQNRSVKVESLSSELRKMFKGLFA